MEFMKWVRSLDELLYEVMSWLVFVPLTLWRAVRQPLAMMDYAERQLALPDTEQYDDALNPPLFLALALLITHGVSMASGHTDRIVANRAGLAGLVNDSTSALILRVVMFASFALFAAAAMVRRCGFQLRRSSLRAPFYAQCYPTGVFAFSLGIGASMVDTNKPRIQIAGTLIILSGIIHYWIVETLWFATRLNTGLLRAAGTALLVVLAGFGVVLLVAMLFEG